MPNHVSNEIRIICNDEKTYDEFKELVKGGDDQEFDFDRIIPQPDDINPDLNETSDWYDWRCTNWGTKWNAYDVEIDWDEEYKECIEINFQTAWSPPEPIYFKLDEIFGDRISVTVVRVGQGGVRIGVEAPEEMEVVREELKADDEKDSVGESRGSRLRAPK